MTYLEKDNQVIITMSKEDYYFVADCLRTLPTFKPSLNRRVLECLDRLNSGNPNYTKHRIGEK
jgi:hypothetical protein